jgi:hypothetical protein
MQKNELLANKTISPIVNVMLGKSVTNVWVSLGRNLPKQTETEKKFYEDSLAFIKKLEAEKAKKPT